MKLLRLVDPKNSFSLENVVNKAIKDFVEKEIDQKVIFHGYQKDIIPWLKGSCCYISMSMFEGLPNATLEAAATMTPMALSDIPAHRQIFDESSAYFSIPEDVMGISESIRDAMNHMGIEKAKIARKIISNSDRVKVSSEFADFYVTLLKE